MSKKWPGGIITPTPATPTGPFQDGLAPGIWTLSQQSYWQKQGLWPVAGKSAQGFFASGYTGAVQTNVIDYVNLTTSGTATSFGQLLSADNNGTSLGSTTRGVFVGTNGSAMTYITFATTGNATSFGTLSNDATASTGSANSTRGLFAGNASLSNLISYITIATTGNGTTFGNLISGRLRAASSASPTRSIIGAGETSGGVVNTIEYVTIATTGNATSFGALTYKVNYMTNSGCSSSTRGLFGAGLDTVGGRTSVISYVTIASTGNSTFFGNLTISALANASASSNIRGYFAGGSNAVSQRTNIIDYVTIATTGNATSFGELSVAREGLSGCSNFSGGVQ